VDDEEELVSALVGRLGYRGIEAKYALTGQQTIELLQEEDFDVVVLDLKLPGMSGTEVRSYIQKEHPDLPVLLITGHGAAPDQLGFKPGEEFDFLEKPFALDVLIQRIKEVARKR
jgi:DNA-binding NtrC family response regulator